MPANHYLTKYDYLQYLDCPESLWLAKNKLVPEEQFTEEEEYIIQQGILIDDLAQSLFHDPAFLNERNIQPANVFFQKTVESNGLVTRCDVLVKRSETHYELYEVKSSTKLKDEHLHDIAFQVVAFEQNDYPVKDTFLVHVNGNYVRNGPIQVRDLLIIAPTTDMVSSILPTTTTTIQTALDYINGPEPTTDGYHSCSQKFDCPFFKIKYPNFPEYSIFNMPRIKEPKIEQLLEAGIYEIKDIPENFQLSDIQKKHFVTAKSMEPLIDKAAIHQFLNELTYPLYFLDYESFAYAVPAQSKIKPYQQMVYQYSLHIQQEPDGELQHFEYLLNAKEEPILNLVEHLKNAIPTNHGHVVVWNKSFEKGRNEDLSVLYSDYKEFFESLNHRLFDLMEVFRNNWYLHPDFKGKYSIKNVLPVLAPNHSYESLSIKNGGISNIRWLQYTSGEIPQSEKEKVWQDLLAYCKLDTLAMVEILKALIIMR